MGRKCAAKARQPGRTSALAQAKTKPIWTCECLISSKLPTSGFLFINKIAVYIKRSLAGYI